METALFSLENVTPLQLVATWLTSGNVLVAFDPIAEKKLVRKIDLFVVPTVAMIYLWCFIDRANIGNAKIAGMEKDLGLKGYQYNILLTAFYVSYIVFEIPSNIACKWIGPKIWLPFISFGFGVSPQVLTHR